METEPASRIVYESNWMVVREERARARRVSRGAE